MNILIVDDDEVMRETITRYLKKSKQPFIVEEATSKSAGKKRLLEDDIDCAIIDYHMGDGDGFSMIEEIRNERPAFNTALILLTGMGNEEIAVRAIKTGINDYISKDRISADVLENAIRTAVAEQKLVIAEQVHQQALQHLSMHDELTGLPNRRLLMERLEQRILMSGRNGDSFPLLMIDLDRFKSVNDTLGHIIGDEVLRIVGKRLERLSRRSDTYARLGGDEFSVLLSSGENIDGAITVAEKIAHAIQQPMRIDDKIVQIDASIGIALFPQHADKTNTLISHADEAMYESKRSIHRYSVFQADGNKPSQESAQISMLLGSMCETEDFSLYYQPKFDLHSGALCGAEALARWHHPVMGEISPAKFIPILERSKFILQFTDSVLHKALRQIADWSRAGLPIPVAVNISPQALTNPDFANRVKELMQEYAVAPDQLIIEITETTNLSNYDSAAQSLIELANHGVGISIDDFGTGYTSIRYLRDFPATELKIDKLFVKKACEEGRDHSIISGIVRLAKGIGARTVAEGIEDPETLDALIDLGCDLGQGYHLGRPTAAANFTSDCFDEILGLNRRRRNYKPPSEVLGAKKIVA